ncbi:hypothetical protein, partial [Pseudomonas aeruginosa]|uniref:hypothetical protein n=1 Tax=Pseudomonas aeruginosa TaxID=287 RepID=UPI001C4E73BF
MQRTEPWRSAARTDRGKVLSLIHSDAADYGVLVELDAVVIRTYSEHSTSDNSCIYLTHHML